MCMSWEQKTSENRDHHTGENSRCSGQAKGKGNKLDVLHCHKWVQVALMHWENGDMKVAIFGVHRGHKASRIEDSNQSGQISWKNFCTQWKVQWLWPLERGFEPMQQEGLSMKQGERQRLKFQFVATGYNILDSNVWNVLWPKGCEGQQMPPLVLGHHLIERRTTFLALSLEAWEKWMILFLASVVEGISYGDFAFYMALFPL